MPSSTKELPVKATSTEVAHHANVRTPSDTPDWEKAFDLLVLMTCTGFVSSKDVEARVDAMRKVNPEAAAKMVEVFNRTRHPLVQALMG